MQLLYRQGSRYIENTIVSKPYVKHEAVPEIQEFFTKISVFLHVGMVFTNDAHSVACLQDCSEFKLIRKAGDCIFTFSGRRPLRNLAGSLRHPHHNHADPQFENDHLTTAKQYDVKNPN